jgi:hypothetical protein
MRPLDPNLVREAIASTAASHAESPNHEPEQCDTCRAASGDLAAFARVVERMNDARIRHETQRMRMAR